MFENLALHGGSSLLLYIARFGMDERDERCLHGFVDLSVRNFGQGLGVGFPAETFGLKAKKLHSRHQ
jgi:hypothetical protein